MNKKKKYRKTSEKDIEFNCLNPIFWIIKTKKKNLVRIHLFTYIAIFQPLHEPILRQQTSKRMKTSGKTSKADKRDEPKERW